MASNTLVDLLKMVVQIQDGFLTWLMEMIQWVIIYIDFIERNGSDRTERLQNVVNDTDFKVWRLKTNLNSFVSINLQQHIFVTSVVSDAQNTDFTNHFSKKLTFSDSDFHPCNLHPAISNSGLYISNSSSFYSSQVFIDAVSPSFLGPTTWCLLLGYLPILTKYCNVPGARWDVHRWMYGPSRRSALAVLRFRRRIRLSHCRLLDTIR